MTTEAQETPQAPRSPETGAPPPGPPQIFSRHRRSFENVAITDYNFKRPERIGIEQMRALQTFHDAFARSFSASLSGYLRTIVEVRVAHAEQMTYSEFIASLPNPTCFSLVDAPALDAQMCLEISPLVVYPIVDRLLGGTSQELFIPQREMTAIESRLIQTILSRAVQGFSEAWEDVGAVEFSLGEIESNPQIVQIVPPNEVVVVIGFEVKLGSRAGTMSLCLPFKIVEPLVETLSAETWTRAGRQRDGGRWEQALAGQLAGAPLEVTGVLAETTVTMADLRRLEVGDVIATEKAATGPVVMEITGRPKFLAGLGQHRGSRALRVLRPVTGGDRLGG